MATCIRHAVDQRRAAQSFAGGQDAPAIFGPEARILLSHGTRLPIQFRVFPHVVQIGYFGQLRLRASSFNQQDTEVFVLRESSCQNTSRFESRIALWFPAKQKTWSAHVLTSGYRSPVPPPMITKLYGFSGSAISMLE